MRISSVLSLADLPAEELQAGLLDGDLVRVGNAYCAIDTIIGPAQRAASLASDVAPFAIAERFTAAWIYGAVHEIPRRLQLCVNTLENVRPFSTQRCGFREVVLDKKETERIGGLRLTTPLRTALDLARIESEFSETAAEAVRRLSTLAGGFSLTDCLADMGSKRNLPFKRMAIERLTWALLQPSVTRYTS